MRRLQKRGEEKGREREHNRRSERKWSQLFECTGSADRSRERTDFSNHSAKMGNELTGSTVAVEGKGIWRGLERNFANGIFTG